MAQVITASAEETQQFAREYLEKHLTSNVLALCGDLGSGKTTFVQGLATSLGIEENVTSPTFVLLKNHGHLYHVDLYRVSGWEDVEMLDLPSIWGDSGNLVVIEWPERIEEYLPQPRDEICFEYVDETTRKIHFPR